MGFGATVHLPAFHSLPGVEVIAIAGRSEVVSEVAAKHGISKTVADWEELLSCELDAVSFALPPMENELACRAALTRKIPVLSEKPIATSAAAAASLANLAEGVVAAVDFQFAELEPFRKLKMLLDTRRLGSVRHVQVTWMLQSFAHKTRLWTWKTDRARSGGATTLLGSHLFFLLEWLLGEIQSMQARASCAVTSGFTPEGARPADDRVDLWLEFAIGATGTATYGNAFPSGPGHRWEIYCDEGMIILENPGTDYMAGFTLSTVVEGRRQVECTNPPLPGEDGRLNPFRALAARFTDAVRTNGKATPDFLAAARVQHLMENAQLREPQTNTGSSNDSR